MEKTMKELRLVVATMMAALLAQGCVSDSDFSLTIVHTNDIHSRYEETDASSRACKPKHKLPGGGGCFGGVARMKTEVDRIIDADQNVIFLNAGDNFQGTSWYSILGWEPTAVFMDLLGYNAMALGNHEFDRGIDGLAPFIRNVSFDVLSSNLDTSKEPKLKDIISKAIIIDKEGRSIGVIGYTTEETANISAAGNTVTFENVIESVRSEAQALSLEGVDIIIALGHAGLSVDKTIASEVREVDIVIGGHTNTFLYDGTPPSSPNKEGPYPFVVEEGTLNNRDSTALVVQDYAYGKYLGRLNVKFDNNGKISSWSGNPILLDKDISEDCNVKNIVAQYKKKLQAIESTVLAKTEVHLNGDRPCRYEECNLGDLIADAYLDNFIIKSSDNSRSNVALAIINSGGIKSSFSVGDIRFKDIKSAQPFNGDVVMVELTGRVVRSVFEHSVHGLDITNKVEAKGKFLQVSGFRITYNLTKSSGNRVSEIKVTCTDCENPQLENIEDDKKYNIVMAKFLADGGDGYHMIRDNGKSANVDYKDADLVIQYLRKLKVVEASKYPKYGNRIRIKK